jgi:D-alanyl-D-alanine carboxypeptidase (penicillin-binding protein 5/6)
LNRDEIVDGLKTGHTEEAGYCLVASSKRENTRFIAVVMGTESESARAAETQKLLAYGFRYFQTTQLYQAGQQVSSSRVWAGKTQEVTLGIPNNIVSSCGYNGISILVGSLIWEGCAVTDGFSLSPVWNSPLFVI